MKLEEHNQVLCFTVQTLNETGVWRTGMGVVCNILEGSVEESASGHLEQGQDLARWKEGRHSETQEGGEKHTEMTLV